MMNLQDDILWEQLVIVDPQALPGSTLSKVIKSIIKCIQLTYVISANIEGAGTSLLEREQAKVLTIEDFLNKLLQVIQFDWGDFYLFKLKPENPNTFLSKDYENLLPKAEVTLRAIDDTYLYIYTKNITIINQIKIEYELESSRTASIVNLDFPD